VHSRRQSRECSLRAHSAVTWVPSWRCTQVQTTHTPHNLHSHIPLIKFRKWT